MLYLICKIFSSLAFSIKKIQMKPFFRFLAKIFLMKILFLCCCWYLLLLLLLRFLFAKYMHRKKNNGKWTLKHHFHTSLNKYYKTIYQDYLSTYTYFSSSAHIHILVASAWRSFTPFYIFVDLWNSEKLHSIQMHTPCI